MQKPAWKVLNTPLGYDLFDRLYGFSLPREGEVVLMSDQGIHVVDLQEPGDIQDDFNYPQGEKIFDPATGLLCYQQHTFRMLGPGIGQPILKNDQDEELILDLPHEVFYIKNSKGETKFDFLFETDSNDWGLISFSEDSRYILLGIPHDFYIFERLTPGHGHSS